MRAKAAKSGGSYCRIYKGNGYLVMGRIILEKREPVGILENDCGANSYVSSIDFVQCYLVHI